MPFPRSIPRDALGSDLLVVTVPGVFGDALSKVPEDRVVLDWMDLWSVNARTVGDAKWSSRVGGRVQAQQWRRRERAFLARSRVNVFAGYDDFAKSRDIAAGHTFWIPTPVSWQGSTNASPRDPGLRTIGFIGNLDYPPNQLSLRQFLDSYGAALARRGLEVLVAGFGSDQVRGWGYPVRVLGPVANVSDFYEVIDAAVVPIDHGGGIKVKAIEALAHGRRVYGTDHVRDGISPELRQFVLPLEQLLSEEQGPGLDVSQETFESVFAPDAFSTAVCRALDILGAP
jgi:glycosyltransferase involved in cell wall biosynthesis